MSNLNTKPVLPRAGEFNSTYDIRGDEMKPISKRVKITLLGCSIALLVVLAFAIPIGVDLYRISKVADQYRLEEAVHTNVINDSIHKPKISEVLSPSFMKKYNLYTEDYLDAQ